MLRLLPMVRAGLSLAGKWCHDYEIPDKVVRKIGTRDVHRSEEYEFENTVVHFSEENVFKH